MREYEFISQDTGRDLILDDPLDNEERVLNVMGQICTVAGVVWVTRPEARRQVIEHLINDHGLHGGDLERFVKDCDFDHIWTQMRDPHESQIGLLYKRDP